MTEVIDPTKTFRRHLPACRYTKGCGPRCASHMRSTRTSPPATWTATGSCGRRYVPTLSWHSLKYPYMNEIVVPTLQQARKRALKLAQTA
jgi:hypothetical protein